MAVESLVLMNMLVIVNCVWKYDENGENLVKNRLLEMVGDVVVVDFKWYFSSLHWGLGGIMDR